MPTAKPTDVAAIQAVLSAPRASTYISEVGGDAAKAMALYGWNARIAAALMLPSHFAEICTRHAVDEALTAVYGPRWPWSQTFELSLPSPKGPIYNPQLDLTQTRSREQTTGKVVAELKFSFWQAMFTARHDVCIWNHQLLSLFPNATQDTAKALRKQIRDDLEASGDCGTVSATTNRSSPEISPTTSRGCLISSSCALPQPQNGSDRWKKPAPSSPNARDQTGPSGVRVRSGGSAVLR